MNPIHSASKSATRGFTLIELLVVACIVIILLALLGPAIGNAQRDARSQRCQNNLKQIALAMHNYHDIHRRFPPGWVNHHPKAGRDFRFGWQAFLTPLLEEAPLYNRLDFDKPAQVEKSVLQTEIEVLRCPADGTPATNPVRDEYGTSNYSGNFGSEPLPRWAPDGLGESWPGRPDTPLRGTGLMWLNSSVGIRDVIDGTSNTAMAGERSATSASAIWAGVRGNDFENDQVTDGSGTSPINGGLTSFSSLHKGGANVALCDGSVRFISEKIESTPPDSDRMGTWQHIMNRRDNQRVGDF